MASRRSYSGEETPGTDGELLEGFAGDTAVDEERRCYKLDVAALLPRNRDLRRQELLAAEPVRGMPNWGLLQPEASHAGNRRR